MSVVRRSLVERRRVAMSMAAYDGCCEAAKRGRLRSFLRHEQLSIAMALTSALHSPLDQQDAQGHVRRSTEPDDSQRRVPTHSGAVCRVSHAVARSASMRVLWSRLEFLVVQINKEIMKATQHVSQECIHEAGRGCPCVADPRGNRGGGADHLTGVHIGACQRADRRCYGASDLRRNRDVAGTDHRDILWFCLFCQV